MANGYARYSAFGSGGGGGSGVSSLNGETGAINLVAGTGITITPVGQNITIAATGAGSGTVTSVSVVSANGFAGTVATPTTTPAITISTTITGILKGDGTAISAAVPGTDYVIPSGSITGTASNITATSNSTLTTLSSLSLPYSQITGAPAAITALTGDGTASGPGSAALTLATVNSNVGSFTNANITVNAKGLITAASNGSSGSGTVTSVALTVPSFLSVAGSPITTAGTLAVSFSGTALPTANGGTNVTSSGTAGNVLVSNGTDWISAPFSGSSSFVSYTSSQVLTLSSAVTYTNFVTFSNSPAFTFTPTITGTYKVYSSVPLLSQNLGFTSICRIVNTSGSGVLLVESRGVSYNSTGVIEDSAFCQSTYTLTAGITYQFDIQGLVQSGGSVQADGATCAFYMFAEGVGLTNAASIMVFTSIATVGGAATEAVTVTGLLSTDTIISVSQKTQGAANLPILGWSSQVNNGISLIYSADMGPGAIVLVAVTR